MSERCDFRMNYNDTGEQCTLPAGHTKHQFVFAPEPTFTLQDLREAEAKAYERCAKINRAFAES